MSILVKVYRSPRQQEMYLYVAADDDLARVPEALLKRFGPPVEALSVELTPERKLARAAAGDVLKNIAESGYYLQMPPTIEALS